MPQEKPNTAGSGAIPKPPAFLKTKRAREVWRYIIRALDQSRLDYSSALLQIALIADKVDCPVLNAGDGQHEHPTQALLDAFTLRRRFGKVAFG